jgi:hypothetical protein
VCYAPAIDGSNLLVHTGDCMIRNGVYFFAALGLFAIAGFWPSYVSRVHQETNLHVHLHGVAMALWCLMLITQGYLIRSDYRPAHRLVGTFSFILVPLIVFSTLSLAHFRVQEAGKDPSTELLYFLYVQLSLLVVFVVAYVLAIANRRTPSIHSGYMVCTALTLVDPVFARLLNNHFGVTPPLMQLLTYAFIDLILLWLIVWGRRQPRPVTLFPAMLAVFVAAQIPTFFLFKTPAWHAFATWYGSLPIP